MRYVNWTAEVSVREPVLDAQHRQVFRVINDLYEAMHDTERPSPTAVRELLSRVRFFTLTHFECEETYMRCARYPSFDAHRAAHQVMISRVKQLEADLDRGALDLFELLRFLKEWWLEHVTTADREYIPYIERFLQPRSG